MQIDFEKGNGLVPVIVQDSVSQQVLMLAYMNREAYEKTRKTGRATFFSRSRNEIWQKGDTSGNWLKVEEISIDCDSDTLLLRVEPQGPVCHKGTYSCFGEEEKLHSGFLIKLEQLIDKRKKELPENSYTTELFRAGINRIAQKVGEEAVELIIEAMDNNSDLFLNEGADLLYHFMVMLSYKGYSLSDIVSVLEKRHSAK